MQRGRERERGGGGERERESASILSGFAQRGAKLRAVMIHRPKQ